jgi:hypothetical protein
LNGLPKAAPVRLSYLHDRSRSTIIGPFYPSQNQTQKFAKISHESQPRTLTTPFFRLIFDDEWKAHERRLAGLDEMCRCASPLPNEQSKEFQLASTNCVGYGWFYQFGIGR